VCAEEACGRKTFVQVTDQLPARARCLTRLRAAVLEAVIGSGRAVEEIASAFAVAWWTVQSVLNAAVMTLPEVDQLRVRLLGINEHRFRTVRFFRDEQGGWRRIEPWMTTFANLATGQVIGVVEGRDGAAVTTWLQARRQAWRDRVEVVAIDPSAVFRSAASRQLPMARVSVDHCHLIRLANLMLTGVRQRVAREHLGHRGRKDDVVWAHRMLLASTDPDAADTARGLLGCAVLGANMPETWRLWETINAWWEEIETSIETRVTNARTEAANTAIKHIKRTGRGYRNHEHYQTRILLRSARQTRRRPPLNQQAATLNCG
jgi:transposase